MTPPTTTPSVASRSLTSARGFPGARAMTLLALSAATCFAGAWQYAGAAVVSTRYTAPRLALELRGQYVGIVRSASGGDGVRDVVVETSTGSAYSQKRLGELRYEPIVIEFDGTMKRPLWDWLTQAIEGRAGVLDAALVTIDANNAAIRRLSIVQGEIVEIMFPRIDNGAREQGKMRVTIKPARTELQRASGVYSPVATDTVRAATRSWSRFAMEIGPIRESTRYAARIESLFVKVASGQDVGGIRVASQASGRFDVSPLVFTVPMNRSDDLAAWQKSFVLEGKNGPEYEAEGALHIQDLQGRPLMTLELKGLGIFSLVPEVPTGTAPASRLETKVYCEQVKLRMER